MRPQNARARAASASEFTRSLPRTADVSAFVPGNAARKMLSLQTLGAAVGSAASSGVAEVAAPVTAYSELYYALTGMVLAFAAGLLLGMWIEERRQSVFWASLYRVLQKTCRFHPVRKMSRVRPYHLRQNR